MKLHIAADAIAKGLDPTIPHHKLGSDGMLADFSTSEVQTEVAAPTKTDESLADTLSEIPSVEPPIVVPPKEVLETPKPSKSVGKQAKSSKTS